jgi:hypothetical protein
LKNKNTAEKPFENRSKDMSFHTKTNFVLVPFSAAVVFDVNERKTTFLRQLKQILWGNVDVSQQIRLDGAKLEARFRCLPKFF